MLTVRELEVRAGARLLLEHTSFQVGPGDKIGLVGRNGAGKTTLTKIVAGEAQPASGSVTRTGPIGYLPQDPRTGDLETLARDRILAARGLDQVLLRLRKAEQRMGSDDEDERDRAMSAYARADAELNAAGGYAAESEAARIAGNLGLPERVLGQPLRTLSGGQRRRVELARILFSDAETLLLDEPTNHLDADSISWLRTFLAGYTGGLMVISHDTGLLEATVNKVFHLDANRAELDVYAMDWKALSAAAGDRREATSARAAERRTQGRPAAHPGRQDGSQGDQGGGRAEHGPAGRAAAGRARGRARLGQGRQDQVPGPGAVRPDAADRRGPEQELRFARGLHRC